jgi:hypothetical protein
MKKISLFIIVVTTFVCCNVKRKDKVADGTATMAEMAAQDSTTVQLIDSLYNFGTVTEGEKVTYNFRFKNTGKKPLIITNTTASCGCTVPEKPEKPILPGETAFIKVVFNSKGKAGMNNKTISVTSNARPEFPQLLLNGEVVVAK